MDLLNFVSVVNTLVTVMLVDQSVKVEESEDEAGDEGDLLMSEDEDAGENRHMCDTKRLHLESGNNLKKLVLFCHGMFSVDQKRLLANFDVEDPVCNDLPDKSVCNPAVPMLRSEVKRRAILYKETVATSQMSQKKCLKWPQDFAICQLHCGRQTDSQRHPDVPNQHVERRRAILDFEVILQFRSRLISLFLQFNICYQQHWICWH